MNRLQRQLILIQWQFIDDAPLLFGILVAVVLLLLTLAQLAFIYPTSLMLHVVCVLIGLPSLVSVGLFLLGVAQAHAGANHGSRVALSVWLITPGQLVLARLAAGVTFVVVVIGCLSVAITGAVMAGLIQWPESLLPQGLIDLSVALLLIGLVHYSLGFVAGGHTASLVASLSILPLSAVFVSIIIIKGLGSPLAVVLVPFFLLLLLYVLLSVKRCRSLPIAAGLVCLTLAAVPFYWLRYCSDVVTSLSALEAHDEVSMPLYGNFRHAGASSSYIGPFTVHGRVDSRDFPIHYGDVHFLLRSIGIMRYLQSKEPGGYPIRLTYFGHLWGFYYDRHKGLFVHRGTDGTAYIGPEGVANAPTERIGRFLSPVVCRADWKETVVCERESRCFYAIDIETPDVRRESRLGDTAFQPVDAIRSNLGAAICGVYCHYASPRDKEDPYTDDDGTYLPLVNKMGTIAVINRRNGNLLMGVGHLPRPYTFFGRGSPKPTDLFSYDIKIIVKQPEEEYAGLVAGSLPRQGTPMTVAVFDRDGRLVQDHCEGGGFRRRALLTAKYLVESLHPPILTLASFFTAYSFDAGATHRALFLMPNSFVALQRDRETSGFFQFLWALLFLAPAVAFSGFLSWRVVRDAAMIGLTRRARGLWLAATLAFGLPAYITYRLTRPQVVMKPCANCGHARRIDRDLCHHCGGGWEVPELDPPAWRITDRLADQGV